MDHTEMLTFAGEIKSANSRAGILAFLAAMFNRPPDSDLVQRLRIVTPSVFFSETIESINCQTDGHNGLTEIREYISSTSDEAEEIVVRALSIDWTRLFRGLRKRYGPPPPYEELYATGEIQGIDILSMLSHIYASEGLEISRGNSNRPDYIGVELDFLRLIIEQEGAAWEKGDVCAARLCQIKSQTFSREHPAQWFPVYLEKAFPKANTLFYHGVLHLMEWYLQD